jgi:hypothetical protein
MSRTGPPLRSLHQHCFGPDGYLQITRDAGQVKCTTTTSKPRLPALIMNRGRALRPDYHCHPRYVCDIADSPLGEAASALIGLASPPRARTGRLPETSEI